VLVLLHEPDVAQLPLGSRKVSEMANAEAIPLRLASLEGEKECAFVLIQ